MKIAIIGAGGQGAACASILAGFNNVEEIRLADLDPELAIGIKKQIQTGREKIVSSGVNALKPEDVTKLSSGVDVVIDMVMPWMAPYVMKGALAAKANYVNTAFDAPYWDELIKGTKPEDLTLSKEFAEEGLTALFGCGFAPGWTNVLARRLANRMDSVSGIEMRVGKATLFPNEQKYDWVFRPWNPGWSPKQALIDCANPTYALEEGVFVRHEPFGGLEMCDFPEPVGKLPVTHHSHEEIYSMPSTFEGIKDVNFKYFLMYQPAMLYTMGLCSEEKIKVGDVEVAPLDVVAALVPPPSDAVFGINDEKLEQMDKTVFIELVVRVSGYKDGDFVVWQANCPKMNAPGVVLKELFGTAFVYVSLPAAIGAEMIFDRKEEIKKGIIFADELDPEDFIQRMLGTGYPYEWTETKS